MSKTHTFLVDMKIDAVLDGTDPAEIKANIEYAIQSIFANGGVTGDTPAFLDGYQTDVIDAGVEPSVALTARHTAETMRNHENYLRDADNCPQCGMGCIDGDAEISHEGDNIHQIIRCSNEDCLAEWDDTYQLISWTMVK